MERQCGGVKFLVAHRDGWCFSSTPISSVSLWACRFATDQLPSFLCAVRLHGGYFFFFCFTEACGFLARVLRDSCYHVVTRRTSTKLSDRREENCAFPPGERLEGVRHQSTSREMTCAAAVWNQKWPSGKTASRQTCGRSVCLEVAPLPRTPCAERPL